MGWSALSPARPAGQARTRLARGGLFLFQHPGRFPLETIRQTGFVWRIREKKVLESTGREWVEEGAWGSMPVCAVSL